MTFNHRHSPLVTATSLDWYYPPISTLSLYISTMPKDTSNNTGSAIGSLKKFNMSSLFPRGMSLEDKFEAMTVEKGKRPRIGKAVEAVKDIDSLTKAVNEFAIKDRDESNLSDEQPTPVETGVESAVAAFEPPLPIIETTHSSDAPASSKSAPPNQTEVPDEPTPLVVVEHNDPMNATVVDDVILSLDLNAQEPSVIDFPDIKDVDVLRQMYGEEENPETEVVTDILVNETSVQGEAPVVTARPTLRRKARRQHLRDGESAFPSLPWLFLECVEARHALELKEEQHDAGGAVRRGGFGRHRMHGTPAYKQSRPARRANLDEPATDPRGAALRGLVDLDVKPFLSGLPASLTCAQSLLGAHASPVITMDIMMDVA